MFNVFRPDDPYFLFPESSELSPVSGAAMALGKDFKPRETYRSPSPSPGTRAVPETPQAPPPTPLLLLSFRDIKFTMCLPSSPLATESDNPSIARRLFNVPASSTLALHEDVFSPPAVKPAQSNAPSHASSLTSVAPTPLDNDPLSSSAISTTDLPIPIHKRTRASDLKPETSSWSDILQAHAVPDETKDCFPPNTLTAIGWSRKRWYVIGKGKEYGIFFDFWGNVKPLTSRHGSKYACAQDYHDAYALFERWEKDGLTERV